MKYAKTRFSFVAHNKLEQLKFLITLLDDSRNDLYLHIDLKLDFDVDKQICDILAKRARNS